MFKKQYVIDFKVESGGYLVIKQLSQIKIVCAIDVFTDAMESGRTASKA